jgi:predicted TIM-barrel fold metal-dependent hydrolase
LIIPVACWLTLPVAGVVRAGIPDENGGEEIKVIDMHTHVFNARDLPLTGVLNALGAPRSVAVIVAGTILASMKRESDESKRELSTEELEHPTVRALSKTQRNILSDYLGPDRLSVMTEATKVLSVSYDAALLAQTLAKIGFPADDHPGKRFRIPTIPELKGGLRIIGILTRQHGEIAATLRKRYPEVDLFVHHMMDMSEAYADKPTVPFDHQLELMQRLDAAFPGKLLHFAAFDPFRRQDALALAERAFTEFAAVGFKIYPPSGYRAAENMANGFPPKPPATDNWAMKRWNSRYDKWTAEDLDKTLQSVFDWTVRKKGIPLFTHCTPGGFEADNGYGKMADPFFWASALKKRDNAGFRLCFGHSGGEAYWFSDPADDSAHTATPPGDDWQFGNQVVDLCLTYPDVYCEVGYLDGILDPKKVGVLLKRLECVVNRPSKDGKWRFGDKLMYGTDWHMIIQEPRYETYLARWDDLIKKVDNGTWRRAFFAGNAKKFLRLDELAKDARFTPEQKKEWSDLSSAIK